MHGNPLLTLLVQVGLILALSRAMGWLFARFHQPQVMGEMVAGIMLGPSLFGWLAPQAAATIFPADTVQSLNVLSQVGVIFFLFLIGLELDPKLLRNRGHAAVVISHVSIIAPFLLGAGLTLYLYTRLFNNAPHMRFTAVALFMGAAMSITAFPVLARILIERNLHKTKVGAVTITCAAVDDVTAWCMLAFVVAVARADGLRPALLTAALSAAYVAVMFFAVRPFLRRLEVVYGKHGRLSQSVMAVVFLLVLGSAFTTEMIGIHALFGAFLMGAIMPKGTEFVRTISEKLEDFTVVFLLPIFFAFTGLRTSVGLLNRPELWLDTGLIVLVACAGKFGGSAVAARACGLGWREACAIGTLMNTRGLMELVILNIGRDLGVITDAVFAMMVLMALVTTFLTTPLLHWVYTRSGAAEAPGQAPSGAFSVLIPVSLPRSGVPLMQLADLITGPGNPARRIFALYLRRPTEREAYRSGIEESEAESARAASEPLAPLLEEARTRGVAVETVSFVTRDVAADIASVARSRGVGIVLMGFHKPVIGSTILGGTVHKVLTATAADVAVLVDRGFHGARKVLVPYMGTEHDRFAIELARRLAKNAAAAVTVMHVVPPGRRPTDRPLDARGAVTRTFDEPGLAAGVTLRVIEDPSPVNAVLTSAKEFDLVIVGVGEEWGLESHLFGWKAERIARDCPTSLLVVRKQPGGNPPGEARSNSGGEKIGQPDRKEQPVGTA